MKNDGGGPIRQTTLRKVVLSTAGLATGLACTCLCLMFGCMAVLIANEIEDTEPVSLVDTTVTIDTSALPAKPAEEDWYPIALRVLRDSGWELPPNLVMLSSGIIPCSPPAALEGVRLEFTATDFVGFIPHHKAAVINLDRLTSTGTVWIYDAGPGLARSQTLELSELTVGLREALEIADANGGQEFRTKLDNSCEAIVWIYDHNWEIVYRESEQPTRSRLHIQVDARSGKIKRVPR